MDKYNRINILLRLAALCSPSDAERKKEYMDEVDDLLLSTRYTDAPVDNLLDLFDFEVPKYEWRWTTLSELLRNNSLCEFGLDALGLGRLLSRISREENGIKRKRTNIGTQYYLPPLKYQKFVSSDDFKKATETEVSMK